MRYFLIGVACAVAAAGVTNPVRAQVPAAPAVPAQLSQAYSGIYPYPFPGVTPRDAYREGSVNRWEFERIEGPLPAAMQGPSVDGNRGGDGGDGGRD
jgi:hypothetical protein